MDVYAVVWYPVNRESLDGYPCSEIEVIVRNRQNLVGLILDESVSGPCGVTYGVTSSGEQIGVIWEAECGNPLHVRPVKVIKTV
jgi:hypothetical protein